MAVTFLLLDEYFATGDDRFVDALLSFHVPGTLATLADRWKNDARPWARRQVLRYLEAPLVSAGHETVVKRLFKHFEAADDDEVIGAFAVAFDRQVRRKRGRRWRWDFQEKQGTEIELLETPRDSIPARARAGANGPVVADFKPAMQWPGRKLFSYHTRYYLRRRAWRCFRRLGHRRPADYSGAVAAMLARYRDDDLQLGENILDSWSLLHACFGESPILQFDASRVTLIDGAALRDLQPAPQFSDLWKSEAAGKLLIDLLLNARAHLIRVWAIELLQRDHRGLLAAIPVSDIRRLLDHPDEQVQLTGAQLLEASTSLDKLTVADWLELLKVQSPTALETIVTLMSRHVRGDRLDLRQCVELARGKPVPVARLGLEFLRDRDVRTEADREIAADLAGARCASVAGAIAGWALARIGTPDAYRVDRIARFFDSLLRETREAAWTWLSPGVAGWDDPALWSRLVETPYDDVRLHFVRALERRLNAPALDARALTAVWAAVLLGIHRGGRHKLTALRQISDAVRQNPDAAADLLPVLAVAIRSVRPPEARAGLAAVVAAVEARPAIAPLVAVVLPELDLAPQAVTP